MNILFLPSCIKITNVTEPFLVVAEIAIQKANDHNVPVEFTCTGIPITVHGDEEIHVLYSTYLQQYNALPQNLSTPTGSL